MAVRAQEVDQPDPSVYVFRRATAMTMTPRLRKFGLTAHVTTSVSWLGAVAGFMALAAAGLASHDAQTVRAPMSVYKRRGMTRYGRRKQHEQRKVLQP